MPDSLQNVLAEAAGHGVQQLVCNGCWQEDWGRVAAVARAHPAVLPQFGLHPWWVERRSPDWLQQLRQVLMAHPYAGLGEVRSRTVLQPPCCSCCCCQSFLLTAAGVSVPCFQCGLDRGPRMPSADWVAQLEAFEQQLQLAEELQRPVTVSICPTAVVPGHAMVCSRAGSRPCSASCQPADTLREGIRRRT